MPLVLHTRPRLRLIAALAAARVGAGSRVGRDMAVAADLGEAAAARVEVVATTVEAMVAAKEGLSVVTLVAAMVVAWAAGKEDVMVAVALIAAQRCTSCEHQTTRRTAPCRGWYPRARELTSWCAGSSRRSPPTPRSSSCQTGRCMSGCRTRLPAPQKRCGSISGRRRAAHAPTPPRPSYQS